MKKYINGIKATRADIARLEIDIKRGAVNVTAHTTKRRALAYKTN